MVGVACVVLLSACLAGCAAQQTRTAAAPAPIENASLTTTGPVVPLPPVAGQGAPAQTGAAKPVVVSAAVAPGSTKIGKSGGGLASWYGDRFHGGKTANGERFDMAGFSAAHRSFPLPSYVRVTNVSNGRSIVVRVNDRGPYHGGRVIDVSKRTADVLGFRGNGVGTVKLDYIGKAPAASDDRRLLASYQEFGRPSLPPGVQMAALAPVSDGELAADAGSGGAYAVASRAITRSADYVVASAASAASSAKSAAVATVASAKTAVQKIIPSRPAEPATEVAAASPAPTTAYAAPQPVLASVPAALAAPNAAHAKRVVQPSEPALASALPPVGASNVDVSSRIASSFEGFGPSSTTVTAGASLRMEATR